MVAKINDQNLWLAGGLSLLVAVVAMVAWGQDHHWQLVGLSPYGLFPLFGLLAFSILWSQYITIFLSKLFSWKTDLKAYFVVTGWAVLLAIILHPSILVYQLWHDGFGLPPESYLQHFVAPGLAWAALLGTVSFFIFLAYELHRWFDKKSWWKYVNYACELAIIAIFIHGLMLGDQLQHGWFRVVWIIYGIVLVVALIYTHWGPTRARGV